MKTTHPLPASQADTPAELTPALAAALCGLTESTLATKRSRGDGPVYIKRCGKVFYRRADLLAWIEQRTTQHGEVAA